jgi:anti-sigma factor RsiW
MDHVKAAGLLDAYFKGELDRPTMREMNQHFKDCEACRSQIRLRKAHLTGSRAGSPEGAASPEIQAQMARNRDLLVKILLVMLAAWFIWRLKK